MGAGRQGALGGGTLALLCSEWHWAFLEGDVGRRLSCLVCGRERARQGRLWPGGSCTRGLPCPDAPGPEEEIKELGAGGQRSRKREHTVGWLHTTGIFTKPHPALVGGAWGEEGELEGGERRSPTQVPSGPVGEGGRTAQSWNAGGGGGDDLSPLSEWKGPPGTIQWGNKAWDCSWPQLRLLS